MTDPLGLIRSTQQGPPLTNKPTPGGTTPEPGAPSFKDVLMKNIQEVNRLQEAATQAVEDLNQGKRSDHESVLIAQQKADTAFRMLLAVRNRMEQAYDEIKQMRV